MGAVKEWMYENRDGREREVREARVRDDPRVVELRSVVAMVRGLLDEPTPFRVVDGLNEKLRILEARLAILEFEGIGDLSLSAHEGLQEEIGDDLDLNPHAVVESATGESPPSCLECGEHLFDDPPDDKEDDDLW
jgi:hypothetical protein